jgi:hypothetical protein
VRQAVTATFGPNGIGLTEALIAIGLTLVSGGFWWLPELGVRAGALLAPGVVMLWISVPMRAPFMERPPVGQPRKRG